MNTFHITDQVGSDPVAAANDFATDLNTFYQAIDSTVLSTEYSGYQPSFAAWDLSDPKPRQPIVETGFSALVTTGTSVGARESACCVSYRGPYASGENPQSRRGRFYVGPLRADAINTSTGLLNATLVSALQSAADTLITAADASTDYVWVVYSRKLDPTGVGAIGSYSTVISGWVDNNPDYQRRRQNPTRAKSTFAP